MNRVIIPDVREDYVLSFCRHIVPDAQPVYVPYEPMANKPFKECFSVIPQHIATHGGKQVFGWKVRELRGVWLEAEFHTIWQAEDGTFHDVTPMMSPMNKILFFPDPEREYKGALINSVFRALGNKESVKRFIELTKAHYRLRTKHREELANAKPGDPLQRRLQEIEYAIMETQNVVLREHF